MRPPERFATHGQDGGRYSDAPSDAPASTRLDPHGSAGAAPERSDAPAPNRDRALRRARGRLRRYAAANGASRLWTFTYDEREGPRPLWGDRARVKRDWSRLARELRRRWPELAWARVLELHEDGHVHVHAAFSHYVRKDTIARLWGHGFVDARRLSRAGGGRDQARRAAAYLAKYVGKHLGDDTMPGEHAYEVAQGFQPRAVRIRAWSRHAGVRAAIAEQGGEVPSFVWRGDPATGWTGPPVTVLGWGGAGQPSRRTTASTARG